MQITTPNLKKNAREALSNQKLQRAMRHVRTNFVQKRREAAAALPTFEESRDNAVAIKNHTLAHLDLYLEAFEEKVSSHGGKVHWASTAKDAREAILKICRDANATTVTKGKSMISEEIDLNDYLSDHGIEPIETDLGEYIIQLRNEHPSHIIAPAVHVNMSEVQEDFAKHHTHLDPDRSLDEPEALLREARGILREKFLNADVGITGANFLVAETGTSVIVTNEGNGDLTQTIPKIHIVIASLEKVVPTLEDMSQILRVLARSATGQEITVYTTLSTGPRRQEDTDGPEEYHVVLLDNGRSNMLGTEFQDMLRCIRCGACMNHCPVYHALGGHAYGWVYPGPMGSVLSPALAGIEKTGNMPNASTFCGRCEEVCPMRIPLPKMMRHWRSKEFERHLSPTSQRAYLRLWAWFALRPSVYRSVTAVANRMIRLFAFGSNSVSWLPFAGEWTRGRDLPKPEKSTFMQQWKRQESRR